MTLVEVIGFIGMTAGGILIGAWGGFKNRMKTLTVGLIAFGTLAIGMGAVDSFAVYLLLMAVYGVALTMVQTASTTLLQKQSSPQMQGRVFGLFGAMYSGFLPLGMAVFGPLADVVSLRLLMILSGLLLLAMAAIILFDSLQDCGSCPKDRHTPQHRTAIRRIKAHSPAPTAGKRLSGVYGLPYRTMSVDPNGLSGGGIAKRTAQEDHSGSEGICNR